MKPMFLASALMALALLATFAGCNNHDDEPGTVALEFELTANDAAFAFNTPYRTAPGDTVSFTTFKYFVSNIVLGQADGTRHVLPRNESYFLIDHAAGASRKISLPNVPAGEYTTVEFVIGVDSLKNTEDISQRTGALDPTATAQGMYWSWNSGYIFLKAEGTSPQAPLDSASGQRPFQYHIGGFGGYSSKTINNIRTLRLAAPTAIEVHGDHAPEVHITADALELFSSPNDLRLATSPVIMFAPISTQVSDNYKDMFEIHHVHN